MSASLRVALLGGGKMAQQHAAAIRRCRGVQLVAVVDTAVSNEELKSRFGDTVATFSDTGAMLTDLRPDVVHIVTPPGTHAVLARQCLEAGSHVYVEKPFALSTTDAESILEFAESKGLKVCAAHQLLFQEAGRRYRQVLPSLGKIVHVESFFSFKPVRRRTAGGSTTPVDQLVDILPHPVYLLLDALPGNDDSPATITALDVSIHGEVRAVIRRNDALATLVVSLRARPIESWLRIMGTNGMVEADFVLGNVVRHPGPGSSAISVAFKPFSRAWQIAWGSFKALLTLLVRRHKSYPGLLELLQEFYSHIQGGNAVPIRNHQILEAVRLCEELSGSLFRALRSAERDAERTQQALEQTMPLQNNCGVALLTGGTGFLGRHTAQLLRGRGWRVRIPVRQLPSPLLRISGVEYVLADLADPVSDSLLSNVECVLHLAAETGGTKAEHERNTIVATRNLIDVMKRVGVRRLVNVSSLAVLRSARGGRSLDESSDIDVGNLARGPYVWAKAAAESLASEQHREGHLDVKTIRLGPLIDYDVFAPPGRLGREVGRLFVAMGQPSTVLSVCSVSTASSVLARYVAGEQGLPVVLNLIEVPAPSRGMLVRNLKAVRPDLLILWLPFWALRFLSMAFKAASRLFRPRSPALDLYAAFVTENYDSRIAARVLSSGSKD